MLRLSLALVLLPASALADVLWLRLPLTLAVLALVLLCASLVLFDSLSWLL